MLHGDILGERARLSPGKTALIDLHTSQRLTYAQLDRRAAQCAHFFIDHCHLKPGDRVAILSKNRLEFLDAFFAAGKSGIIVVPLNSRLTAPELSTILQSSGARAVLFESDPACEIARNVQLLRQDPGIKKKIEYWIALDGSMGAPSQEPSDIDYRTALSRSAESWKGPRPDPEDVYCLLYTSGTTGKPKGVMIPHRMVAFNGYNTALNWQLRETDVSPVFTPLYHAGGLAAFLIPIFAAGGTIVLHREFDAAEVWRIIEREKVTVMLGVPTIYKMLLEAPEAAHACLSGILSYVRWFISGGAPLPIELVAAYRDRGVALKQGYGLTEVGVNCFSMSEEDAQRKAGSIGRPMMFTEAKLLKGELGNEETRLPADGDDTASQIQGELCLRGPHVCKGYWNDPAATLAVLDSDGWFHTGDIARRDAEGFFYIVGRSKDMFISGGVNVYPAEIEAELLRHPSVADAAVIGVPHPTWGEVGIAFIVLKTQNVPGANGNADEKDTIESLNSFLSTKLAKFKLPKEFVFVESLPRTAYGKVVKGELRERYKS